MPAAPIINVIGGAFSCGVMPAVWQSRRVQPTVYFANTSSIIETVTASRRRFSLNRPLSERL
jgi:hypothetical protein